MPLLPFRHTDPENEVKRHQKSVWGPLQLSLRQTPLDLFFRIVV
jgi:hypothetical protein